MQDLAIGIDIGGTNTTIGAVTSNGKIIQELSFSTSEYNDFNAFFDKLVDSILQLKKTGTLRGIGLGAPAGNHFEGTIQAPANVSWQETIPIKRRLEHEFKLPIAIDNDANAAAIGEMYYGATREVKDFILITLGTGLGSGIVINGQLLYGSNGFAGELGHIVAKHGGRQCGCGKKGCLETYVSATGIKRTAFELLAQNPNSLLRQYSYNEIEAKNIYEMAQLGDKTALKAFEMTGKYLGQSLADYTAFSEPKAFILFGGLANAGNLILKPTRDAFEKELLFLYKDKVEIKLSELMDDNAAVLGASALVWQVLNKHSH